ncbi:energy-converting hydrogenase B subunit J [Methanobacterium sp.]|uniref:energy-converting hydrogenase B subunit J n=1 Tax=Methanobacterium sp. TaxID=2164 RepID=UPI003C72013C
MIFYLGPLVLGFLMGFIIGTRIKPVPESKLKFDKEVYAVVVIVGVIIAIYQAPFPYYQDIPLASGFLAGLVGIILGKLTFGR